MLRELKPYVFFLIFRLSIDKKTDWNLHRTSSACCSLGSAYSCQVCPSNIQHPYNVSDVHLMCTSYEKRCTLKSVFVCHHQNFRKLRYYYLANLSNQNSFSREIFSISPFAKVHRNDFAKLPPNSRFVGNFLYLCWYLLKGHIFHWKSIVLRL